MTALAQARVEAAGTLRRSTTLPVAEVGLRVGFADASCFSRRFKEIRGLSPMEYRRQEVGNGRGAWNGEKGRCEERAAQTCVGRKAYLTSTR